MRGATGGQPLRLRAPGVTVEPVGWRGRQHQRVEAGGLGQPRQHVAIAAIVARATYHGDAPRLWPARAQDFQGAFGGTRHQGVRRNLAFADLVSVQCAHLCGGVDGGRPVHGGNYTGDSMNPPDFQGQVAAPSLPELKSQLDQLARARGFEALGVSDVELSADAIRLGRWLDVGLHGEMGYMSKHGSKRTRPGELVPGTLRVLSARMNYWPPDARDADEALADEDSGYVSRYALGRDYHKLL